uniref:Uncharacterized protein n=1 Tax=Rousettus aegyptiacus TaxID=9407 RepID=A0A7J8B7P7_ROUAE|nr:hypothetical protein HJG63_010434 [Rousettus aegyptiacus]
MASRTVVCPLLPNKLLRTQWLKHSQHVSRHCASRVSHVYGVKARPPHAPQQGARLTAVAWTRGAVSAGPVSSAVPAARSGDASSVHGTCRLRWSSRKAGSRCWSPGRGREPAHPHVAASRGPGFLTVKAGF